MSCCRASQVGADKQALDALRAAVEALESRSDDKIRQDMSMVIKKSLYDRLLAQAVRVTKLTEE
tara:strand:+ start:248005 stop:248196 length:192 start_codon:yes stop_codon:yes gene_type:complete